MQLDLHKNDILLPDSICLSNSLKGEKWDIDKPTSRGSGGLVMVNRSSSGATMSIAGGCLDLPPLECVLSVP